MDMQTFVCGGLVVLAVVVILLLRGKGGEAVLPVRKTLRGGGGEIQPLPGGSSGPQAVDIWDEIAAQGQPALTDAQAANRQALAQAARVWELTGNVGLPDVTVFPSGGGRELGPGEPTVRIILQERQGAAVRRFYEDEGG